MKIFNKQIEISVIRLITILLFFAILLLGYIFFFTKQNEKANTVFSGLFTGLIVALFQLIMGWYEYSQIDKFKSMKIKDVRVDRDGRDFYESLIKRAKSQVKIMGVTAFRFMSDFADPDSTQERAKVLLSAMAKGVKVHILIPDPQYLDSQEQKNLAASAKQRLDRVAKEYPQNFTYKYFNHIPTHSIFQIDDLCIIGPVFPHLASKDTPAIFLESTSPFAKKYLEYLEDEWNKV